MEHFESNGCARRARKLCGETHWGGDLRAQEKVRERASCAEKGTGEATYAYGRKCENALELRGKIAPAKSPG